MKSQFIVTIDMYKNIVFVKRRAMILQTIRYSHRNGSLKIINWIIETTEYDNDGRDYSRNFCWKEHTVRIRFHRLINRSIVFCHNTTKISVVDFRDRYITYDIAMVTGKIKYKIRF